MGAGVATPPPGRGKLLLLLTPARIAAAADVTVLDCGLEPAAHTIICIE